MDFVFLLGYVDEVVHTTVLFVLDEVVKTKMMMSSFGKTDKFYLFFVQLNIKFVFEQKISWSLDMCGSYGPPLSPRRVSFLCFFGSKEMETLEDVLPFQLLASAPRALTWDVLFPGIICQLGG